MHVLHVGSDLSRASNGVGSAVSDLVASIEGQGATCDILTTGAAQASGMRGFPTDLQWLPALGKLCFSRALSRALDQAAASASVVHSHGLWRMPNIYPARAAAKAGVPIVVSPHGMLALEAMKYSSLQKRAFWRLAQHDALRSVTCFHATSVGEVEEIRRAGLSAPVALIPLGVDIPAPDSAGEASGPPTVLYIGRLHPKKGIDLLVDAWARVEADFPDWRLRIVGPSELGYVDSLKAQASAARLQRVDFEDALYGDAKAAAFREAELFVLPTRNENFGLVVAEALAAGTPVICSKGAPWQGLVSEQCGWWVDHGVAPFETALREALSETKQTRADMGARGRAWVTRDYSWQGVGRQMVDVYRWTRDREPVPACLIFD